MSNPYKANVNGRASPGTWSGGSGVSKLSTVVPGAKEIGTFRIVLVLMPTGPSHRQRVPTHNRSVRPAMLRNEMLNKPSRLSGCGLSILICGSAPLHLQWSVPNVSA